MKCHGSLGKFSLTGKGETTSIFKKGKKEDPGKYRPLSLALVPGKAKNQSLLETLLRHLKNKEVIDVMN